VRQKKFEVPRADVEVRDAGSMSKNVCFSTDENPKPKPEILLAIMAVATTF
jgi:hypothetical protein